MAEDKRKAEEAAARAVWSDEELRLLAQGMKKFPGGMPGRWAKV